MKNSILERFSSDKAAANTTEIIIIIALAVFAGLALFSFILRPIQNSASNLGKGIDGWIGDLLGSKGGGDPTFDGGNAFENPVTTGGK